MIDASISLLRSRNEELSSMIVSVSTRGAALNSEIERILRRDQKFRILVHNLLSALTNRSNINSPSPVEGMAGRITIFLNEDIRGLPKREHGIKRAIKRFEAARDLLLHTAQLIRENSDSEAASPAITPEQMIVANLASASDLIYAIMLDIETKHVKNPNRTVMERRIAGENRRTRDRIRALIKKEQNSG
jgi:hypothetical protein